MMSELAKQVVAQLPAPKFDSGPPDYLAERKRILAENGNHSRGRGISTLASRGIDSGRGRGISTLASRGIDSGRGRGISTLPSRGIDIGRGRGSDSVISTRPSRGIDSGRGRGSDSAASTRPSRGIDNGRGRGANSIPVERKGSNACFNCGQVGHTKSDCKEPKKELPPSGPCYNCGDAGHISKDCPNPKKERPPLRCYNCNKEDANHLAKDCPEPQKEPRKDQDGNPLNTSYVPKMRDVESLFEEDIKNEELYRNVFDGDCECKVIGAEDPILIETWSEADFDDRVMANIDKSKYTRPRKIQAYCIPYIMLGFDILGHAETGSGKTGAFLIPIIDKILKTKDEEESHSRVCAPQALIITPTRELSLQITEQATKFGSNTGVRVCKAYGLYHVRTNISELQSGCDILVGTAGRLKMFFERKIISPVNLKYLVLDEADRLFGGEKSFGEDIDAIMDIEGFPKKGDRQTMMFSATLPDPIQKDAKQLLREGYITISNTKFVEVNSRVKQEFIEAKQLEKDAKLLELLQSKLETKGVIDRTLVFVEKRERSKQMAMYLNENGIPAMPINGEMGQDMRERSLSEFRGHNTPVLISTDVCARGIDVKDLEHVINLDLPEESETYVHRIGRTGRLREGLATSFVDCDRRADKNVCVDIVRWLRNAGEIVPDFLAEIVQDRQYRLTDPEGYYEKKVRRLEMDEPAVFLDFEELCKSFEVDNAKGDETAAVD